MSHATTVASVLLLASAIGAVCHHEVHSTTPDKHHLTVFLRREGRPHRTIRPVRRRATHHQAASFATHTHGPIYTVTATAYQAVEAQTDDEPFVTADNSFIKPGYSSKLRWLAVSQDLLTHRGGRIKFGDRVHVRGVSAQLDGVYTVHDTMNRRHRHCIDILSHPREKLDISAKGVKLQLVAERKAPPRLLSSARQAKKNRPASLAKGGHTGRRKATKSGYLTAAIL